MPLTGTSCLVHPTRVSSLYFPFGTHAGRDDRLSTHLFIRKRRKKNKKEQGEGLIAVSELKK